MTQPDDPLFENLLQDYAAPVADDGFTDHVMAQITAETEKQARLRRLILWGASFTGGVIAATQLPGLVQWLASVELSTGDAITNLPMWAMTALIVFGFAIWGMIDSRETSLF